MKIRFQADADLSEDIVTGIVRREPRIDFRTASEAGLRGLSDAQVLALVRIIHEASMIKGGAGLQPCMDNVIAMDGFSR